MRDIPRLRELIDDKDPPDLHAILGEFKIVHPRKEAAARGKTPKEGYDAETEVIYLDGQYLTSGSYYCVAHHVARWLHAYGYRAGMGIGAADVALEVYTFDCGLCPRMLAAARVERTKRRESDTFKEAVEKMKENAVQPGADGMLDLSEAVPTVTLYVLHTEEDQHRTPENALDEFKTERRHIHKVTLPGGEDAEVRAACKVLAQIKDYHTDGDTDFFLVARSDEGDGLVLVETCTAVDVSHGGEIAAFDPLPDEDDGPAVCPGCHAVGPEPHASDCMDEQRRMDDEDRRMRGELYDPTDDDE